jgi:hypothetical protein
MRASHAHRQLTSSSRSTVLIAVLACLAVVEGTTSAATYYLNTSGGSDSNPGTSSAPWKTLSKVQSSAAAGDTIVIQSADAGTYATPWPTHVSYKGRVLRQFEITWTFDTEYTVGQFANRDLWVVGPVKIVGISPASTSVSGRIINGSMLNPPAGWTSQGYDSAMPNNTYSAALNVAYGRSAGNPLMLQPSSSLISSISLATVGGKTTLQRAAILTVLSGSPPAGSFPAPLLRHRQDGAAQQGLSELLPAQEPAAGRLDTLAGGGGGVLCRPVDRSQGRMVRGPDASPE